MTADVVPRMEAASPALNLPSAAKLRPSPAVPGSMESAIKMWLQVGNVQKLQQVSLLSKFYGYSEYRASINPFSANVFLAFSLPSENWL